VRGCWGSDFSHFHRGAQIISDPTLSAPWTRLRLERFPLHQTNQALQAVSTARTIKALITPRDRA
jgi:hypothetical protein